MSKLESQSFCQQKERAYARVSQKVKQRLIELVISKGRKIISTAKFLKISPENARMIIYRHKKKLQRRGSGERIGQTSEKHKACVENEANGKNENMKIENLEQIGKSHQNGEETTFYRFQVFCLFFSVYGIAYWQ